jgi:hypothetical protein
MLSAPPHMISHRFRFDSAVAEGCALEYPTRNCNFSVVVSIWFIKYNLDDLL